MGVSYPGSLWMDSCRLPNLRPACTTAAALGVSLAGEALAVISKCPMSVTGVTRTAMDREVPAGCEHARERLGEIAALKRLAQHFIDADIGRPLRQLRTAV